MHTLTDFLQVRVLPPASWVGVAELVDASVAVRNQIQTIHPNLSIAAVITSSCIGKSLRDAGSNPAPASNTLSLDLLRDSLAEERSLINLNRYIKRRWSRKIAAIAGWVGITPTPHQFREI